MYNFLFYFWLAIERGHHSQWWSVTQYSPWAVGKEAGIKRKTGSHHHSTPSKEGKVSITEKTCIKENRRQERSKEIQGNVFILNPNKLASNSCRELHTWSALHCVCCYQQWFQSQCEQGRRNSAFSLVQLEPELAHPQEWPRSAAQADGP